jgi:endonuclease YncB( thermonuclease family)
MPWSLAWGATCDLQLPGDSNQVEKAGVRQVIDGDTVRLRDGRLVRFVGINTPEIDHEAGIAEPFARAARDFVRSALDEKGRYLLLHMDRETHDRHGRVLAHVFTADGKNLQAQLIRQGLGLWIVVPPNLGYMACYRAQEQVARQQQRGVWNAQFKQPRDARSLRKQDRGLQWIQGTVTRIGRGKRYLWLNLGNKAALRVDRDDLHYFKDQPLTQLKGKTVTARGWMFPYKRQLVMSLKHPASMQILQEPN